MAKCKRNRIEESEYELFESESEDDFSSNGEEDYVPTAEEIAAVDAEYYYDSESGESVDNLNLDLRQRAATSEQVYFTSKDGKIIYEQQPTKPVRKHTMNTTPGPTTFAVNKCSNILDSFFLFIQPIEKDVIAMTNLYGIKTYEQDWKSSTAEEIRAYIGLLLLAGVFRSYGESVEELWNDADGRPIFRATMTLERFKQISKSLRFDDKAERRQRDKLAPIRCVYDKWNKNLSRMYNPGPNVTVDEQLVPYRGRCPFKQYIPSKPARYGIKIWSVCDSSNAYTWNTQVYTGKAPNTQPETNQGKRVVLELTEGLKGRTVTTDNFFSSHELAVELSRRQLSFIGTVRKNKTFIPPKLLDMKKKPANYSEFLFDNVNKISMVAYVPKKNRLTLLLSSAHMNKNVALDEKRKPVIIEDYNKTKGGVDLADQMIGTYTCKRKVNRWPVALFGYILDTSALNAFIIYSSVFPNWNVNKTHKRRLFLKELGQALVSPFIKARSRLPQGENAARVVRNLRESSEAATSTSSESSSGRSMPPPKKIIKKAKRVRCSLCPYTSSGTKYSTFCSTCGRAICPAHTSPSLCVNCKN